VCHVVLNLSGADGGTLRLQAFFELHQIGHGAREPVELGANQPIARTAKVDRRVKLRALGIDARELLAEYLLDACGLEVDTGTPNGRLMFNVIASIAQFEREVMLARRREGIAKAKSEGKYKGRAPTARAKSGEVLSLLQSGVRATEVAKQLGIGRRSVYRIIEAAAAKA
jgi:DNA invertase Pin-like site-specific DNA recombinase